MKNQVFLTAVSGIFDAVKGIMRSRTSVKRFFVLCISVCLSVGLQAQRASETQKRFAENIHITDPSLHASLHKKYIDSNIEEIQMIVSSNIHKYDKSARSEAYKASIATRNSKVIAAANESLDKVNWEGVDRSIRVNPSSISGGTTPAAQSNLSATELYNMAQRIGNRYTGELTKNELIRHWDLIRQAAEKGHSSAMCSWGRTLYSGNESINLKSDREKGIYYMKKGLENKDWNLNEDIRKATISMMQIWGVL